MNDLYFEAKNELNEPVLCKVLHTFSHNSNNYMIYTDYELDESDNIVINGAKYKQENGKIILEALNEDEFELIDNYWRSKNE